MKKHCCLWVLGLLIISVPIIGPPEEGPNMDREQFEVITVHADNDIKSNVMMKNIAKKDTNYFFLKWTNGSPKTYMMSSSDFESDDSIEITFTESNAPSQNFVVRQFGNTIYGACFLDGNLGSNLLVAIFKSTDSGDTWSRTNYVVADDDDDRARVIDIIYVNSVYWLVYSWYDNNVTNTRTMFGSITNNFITKYNGAYNNLAGSDLQKNFGGTVDTTADEYEFVDYQDDSKFYYNIFDGTAHSTKGDEETSFTVPTAFSIQDQIYWHKGNMKFLMTKDKLFIYDFRSASWTIRTVGSPTDVNGVIWDKNSSDEYIINFLFWNDQLLKMFKNGGIASIQTLSGINAYVGYGDWFSTGSAIYIKVP